MINLVEKKDQIISMYKDDKYSLRKIAKILDCSYSGVKRILKKYNIPRRNKCESLNLCPDEFSDKELSFLTGTLLGDGSLSRYKKKGESCFYIGHSVKQKEYIEYKYNLMKKWIGCKIYTLNHTLENNKTYSTLNFLTRRSKCFTELRDIFYKDYKKIVPFEFIEKNFNEFSLAILMMDDGYNHYNRGFCFCSEGFTEKENCKLSDFLNKKFNLKTYVRRRKKDKYRIFLIKKDKMELFEITKKYIILSMSYKIKSPEAIR